MPVGRDGKQAHSRGRGIRRGTWTIGLGLASAAAQGNPPYPSRPIKLIVPYTPGSPVDVLARVVTQQLSARLAPTIVIDNRPGAGTTIGTKCRDRRTDGYTLLIGATSLVIAACSIPISISTRSRVSPGGHAGGEPAGAGDRTDVPAKTVQEFIAYAKANPGKLNFGFGQGTLPQFVGELFKAVTDTQIANIPYKGGAQAITDMLGGRVQMNFGTISTLAPLIRQGKLRALAVTTATRAPNCRTCRP